MEIMHNYVSEGVDKSLDNINSALKDLRFQTNDEDHYHQVKVHQSTTNSSLAQDTTTQPTTAIVTTNTSVTSAIATSSTSSSSSSLSPPSSPPPIPTSTTTTTTTSSSLTSSAADSSIAATPVSTSTPAITMSPTATRSNVTTPTPSNHTLASIQSVHPQLDLKLNSRFMLMPINDQIRELQTVIRDKSTSRGDFKFYADRLIRLVVEEGLNQLPIERVDVKTPTGHIYKGIRYLKGNCGVSIVRSGESMEQGLRDCCRSIRIGKILIETDENNQARVLYAKFPKDVAERKILLLYPIMSTGLAVIESVKVLLSHGVREENLILLNLFSSPKAAKLINHTFSKMFILTSDVNPICPNHFGHRYFGTD